MTGERPLLRSAPERIVRALYDHPRALVAFLVAFYAAAVALLPHLRVDSGIDVYFDRSQPLQQRLDEINESFVNDDLVFVVYEQDDVFARASLEEARDLGRWLEALSVEVGGARTQPFEDVDGLATVKDLVGREDSYGAEPLVADPIPRAREELERIRARAMNNPLIEGHLVAADSRFAAFALRFAADVDEPTRAQTIDEVRAELARRVARGAAKRYELTGQIPLDLDIARYQNDDVARFIPIVYGVLALLVFSFLRRWLGAALALANVLGALITGFASLVAVGSSLNTTSAMIPPAVMALNVALLTHFFSEYARAEGRAPPEVLADLLPPIFMAELTTAIGFAGLAATNIPAVRGFALAAALAILVGFVSSFLVLTLVARYVPPARLVSTRGLVLAQPLSRGIESLVDWAMRRHVTVLAGAAVFAVLMGLGAMRIVVDQNDLELFRPEAPIRQATELMDAHFGGGTVLVAAVRAEAARAFDEPANLRKLEALGEFLRAELGAEGVVSLADYVKLMRRELFGGAAEHHRLPDSREQTAQLLLISSDSTLEEYVDPERRWVRVVARTREHSFQRIAEAYRRIDAYLATHFPASEGFRVDAVADSRLLSTLIEEIIDGQVNGTLWSGLPICLLMMALLRSIPLGLFSLLPNVFPIFINFGLMGWSGIKLNTATVMISIVALGIVVDDTVHFLQSFKARMREHREVRRAVREAMHAKGVGMVGVTSIVALTFSVTQFSEFAPTRDFSLLMAIVMVAALVSDMVLMPAALAAAGRIPGVARRLLG